ncbi:MAG: hypothetical protein CMJ51_02930 [Planctomycetaceae bacterium]|nr:hypothetical protein [Planctomycetaceae bacterium]
MPSLEPPIPLSPVSGPDSGRRLLRATAAADADGVIQPAHLLVEGGRLLAVGSPADVGESDLEITDLGSMVVIPALVNAHVHLDLTEVGPISIESGFESWLDEVRCRRPSDPESTTAAVGAGITASLIGGVVAVGDIAGAFGLDATRALAAGRLGGTSFVEVFGIGQRLSAGTAAVDRIAGDPDLRGLERPGFRVGISPHAPYSCGVEVYERAARTGLPVTTHLAETPEEAAFTRNACGPFVDLLRRVGSLGDGDPREALGVPPGEIGPHPIDLLTRIRPVVPWLVAHLNYPTEPDERDDPEVDDVVFQRRATALRDLGASVAFCPRASRFLGHPRPGREGHPWRRLLAAGVPVALGTDGMPCLDTPTRLSPLDDVRLLLRDGAELTTVLGMATTAGAKALGLRADSFRLSRGGAAGLIGLPFDSQTDVSSSSMLGEALGSETGDPIWITPPGFEELG